ncbi:LamG-like jellyroll fold domain-containing protein [Glaciibacter superstes]|uniref:LamG-like jellyroll fold domain-containing protein n=1 Tax=Glaciibacter superstes TaxID=501023 RepID=UPI0003B787E0|nr:LamG-like jellyroll fold domain-containing protein [Glaciibacter superstes]
MPRRLIRTSAIVITCASLSLGITVPGAQAVPVATGADAADLASRFTLAVLPDTQFYSRYATEETGNQFGSQFGSEPFSSQTRWLADHDDDLKIPFVTHLGDVVDQVDHPQQWAIADTAMSKLEDGGVPYSILAGNHDVLDSNDYLYDDQYDLANEPYLQTFSAERAAAQSTFGGRDATGMNEFHIFEAEGQQYLVLALAWRASDATLAWANQVLADHPTLPAILTTHQVIDIEPDGITPKETEYGLRLWDGLIRGNDQIFLTLNGHFHGASRLDKINDAGHTVTEMVIDYQMAYMGGNGYLSLFEFDLTNNAISVETVSPWVIEKPVETLTSYDQAILTGPHQQFTMPIDFQARFAGFNPDFAAGSADEPSLSQEARDLILADYTEPTPVETEAPGNRADFIEPEGTLAHWRFGDQLDGGAVTTVAEGGIVEDVVGENDLTRASVADSGSPTAEVGDVTFSPDHANLSSDGGSICFADSDRNTGRFSYLSTDPTAPVNDVSFDDGYTIESFLKLDADWSAENNQWMMALIRGGNRNEMPGVPYDQWGNGGPAVLGVSNLKEVQFSVIPNQPELGDRVNWSGEIQVDTWIHVAVVNDPDARTTTLYVEGAPVLRNAFDTVGQSFVEDAPWFLGAGMDNNAVNGGWHGCIGETRIVDRPLESTEWMTARADLSTLAIDAPAGTVTADTSVSAVTGTGLAGADVTLGGALSGSTSVAENGTWSVDLGAPLAAGDYAFTARQSLGERSAEPVTGAFSILAPTVPPVPTDPGGPGSGSGSGDGSGGGTDPAGAAPSDDGSLAHTGVDIGLFAPLGAVLLLIGGALALLVSRLTERRRRARAAA